MTLSVCCFTNLNYQFEIMRVLRDKEETLCNSIIISSIPLHFQIIVALSLAAGEKLSRKTLNYFKLANNESLFPQICN